MSRRLVVNADDFNSEPDRSEGILQSGTHGIVTSTSVLSNLPLERALLMQAVEVFRGSLGVHLNITCGRPLSEGSRTLTRSNGEFFSKRSAWRRAMLRRYDLEEVEREFEAQCRVLCDFGVQPSHFDSNNHLHVFPGFPEVVCRVAARCGIRRIRLPSEASIHPKPLLLRLLARSAKGVFARHAVSSPVFFAGIVEPDCTDVDSLMKFVRQLPPGVCELMCHPGLVPESGGRLFSTEVRRKELAALCDPALKELISSEAVELCGYQAVGSKS